METAPSQKLFNRISLLQLFPFNLIGFFLQETIPDPTGSLEANRTFGEHQLKSLKNQLQKLKNISSKTDLHELSFSTPYAGKVSLLDSSIEPQKNNFLFIFVEGFLLFADPKNEISQFFDFQIWVEIDQITAFHRCQERDKNANWTQKIKNYSNWFDSVVWKNYLKFKEVQLKNCNKKNFLKVVGSYPIKKVCVEIESKLTDIFLT